MEIAPGVYSMGARKGGRVRAFLVDHGSGLILIDTLFESDASGVLALLKELGKEPKDLTHILVTHAHRSHLGGLAVLKGLSGAPVCAHEWEADIISGDRQAQAVTFWPMGTLETYPLQLGLNLHLEAHTPCPVDRHLTEDDAIGPLQVLHIPGHTPGHLAFFWPERKLLFGGDAVASWPSFGPGWRAFQLNYRQHSESVRRLAALQPKTLAIGHGDPILDVGDEHLHALVEVAEHWIPASA